MHIGKYRMYYCYKHPCHLRSQLCMFKDLNIYFSVIKCLHVKSTHHNKVVLNKLPKYNV